MSGRRAREFGAIRALSQHLPPRPEGVGSLPAYRDQWSPPLPVPRVLRNAHEVHRKTRAQGHPRAPRPPLLLPSMMLFAAPRSAASASGDAYPCRTRSRVSAYRDRLVGDQAAGDDRHEPQRQQRGDRRRHHREHGQCRRRDQPRVVERADVAPLQRAQRDQVERHAAAQRQRLDGTTRRFQLPNCGYSRREWIGEKLDLTGCRFSL